MTGEKVSQSKQLWKSLLMGETVLTPSPDLAALQALSRLPTPIQRFGPTQNGQKQEKSSDSHASLNGAAGGEPLRPSVAYNSRNSNSNSTEKKVNRKQVSFSKMLHPKTGKSGEKDPTNILRFVVEGLNKEKDLQKGKIFHTLPGSMTDRLIGSLGIKNTFTADMMLVMQELGMLRLCGRHKSTTWQVIDLTHFDSFVDDVWIAHAIHAVLLRHAASAEVRKIKKNAQAHTNGDVEQAEEMLPDTLAAMAEMVAEVERMKEELLSAQNRIKELESELDERPKDDPNDVAAALIARFKKAKES